MLPLNQRAERVGRHQWSDRSTGALGNWDRDGNSFQFKVVLWLGANGLGARQANRATAGFTLLESLTVVAMIGILSAIAATSWLSFFNTWRLTAAQDQVYQAMIIARSTAKQEHRRMQASFRTRQNQVEWAVHPVNANTSDLDWKTLPGAVKIDANETTLYRSNDDTYRVQFDHKGNTNGRLGRLTLAGINPHKARRCVFVSTLIGTLRKARDRPTPQNGRYCY